MLRVRSIAGQTPNLNYNLTRQPDLDPDELERRAAGNAERGGSYPGCRLRRQARLLAGLRVPDLATRARTGAGRPDGQGANKNRRNRMQRRRRTNRKRQRKPRPSGCRSNGDAPARQCRTAGTPAAWRCGRQVSKMWARWASAVRSEMSRSMAMTLLAAGGHIEDDFAFARGQRSEQGIEIGASAGKDCGWHLNTRSLPRRWPGRKLAFRAAGRAGGYTR